HPLRQDVGERSVEIENTSSTPLRQTIQLQALYQLSVELSALHSLESVLSTALKHCLDLTGSQFGFIGLMTADQTAMDVVEVQGFHPAREFYDHFRLIPLRPNLFSRVVLENDPVRTDDAQSDPRRIGQPRGHPGVKTFLGVPLRIRETPIGMIGVANRKLPYDLEHEHLLMTYAAQVAIVIRNVQLYEELVAAKADLEQKVAHRTRELQTAQEALAQKAVQLRQLFNETVDIQEAERQRIAQDMHDGINQLLIGAMLELKSGRERLAAGNLVRADHAFQAAQGILRNVETEIRRVVYDLRPPTLDALGFVSELRRYIQDFKQYANLNCVVHVEGENIRLPAPVEISTYRLAQEALQNVYSHAEAHNVEIKICFTPDALELSICDDGVGFDLAAVDQTRTLHFGLVTMRERAKSLNGQLTIRTRAGCGTCVVLSVPTQGGSVRRRDEDD
ncbi:MAG TPA: GAF domain-containing sensor histidine kinase, partial [Aggregatilineales bacterium]|nr:GAF domain-containing sensor histidine kinase [Aggregatilineales bacterium]